MLAFCLCSLTMNISFLSLLSIALYGLATLLQFQNLQQGRRSTARHPLGVGFMAILAHAATLASLPLAALSLSSTLSLTAAGMAFTITFACLRYPLQSLQLAAYPLAMCALVYGLHQTDHPSLHESTIPRPVLLHAALSMVAFILLGVAMLQAAALHWQNRQLKQHRFPRMMNLLPPLQTTERILFGLIWVGMITLTLAIVTGSLYVEDLFAQRLAHKTVLSILSWLLFAALLCGRYFWGWRGLFAARMTLIGSLFLALGFIGSKFVIEIVLGGHGA